MRADFSKFIDDLEKRQEAHKKSQNMTQEQIEHHQNIMKRNFEVRERWQNRIHWRNK